MARVIIPNGIVTPFAATKGEFTAVYSKPAGSDVATVFVGAANQGAALKAVSEAPATASFVNGILHVNLGAKAVSRSAAGIAAENTVLERG